MGENARVPTSATADRTFAHSPTWLIYYVSIYSRNFLYGMFCMYCNCV